MRLRGLRQLGASLALALALVAPQAADAAPAKSFKSSMVKKTSRSKTAKPRKQRRSTKAPRGAAATKLRKVVAKGEPKLVSAKKAAALIKPGAHVYVPIGHSVGHSVLSALTDRATGKSALNSSKPVRIVGLSNVASRSLYATNKIVPNAVFVGANNRDAIAAGRGGFIPTHLSRVPRLIKDGSIRVDVALIQVSPPDKNGNVTLGPTAAATLAAVKKARVVIAEVNPNVPRTYGATVIPKSKINYMVKSNAPLREVPATKPSAVDRRIARNITQLIPKNPTLQFGIGGTTDAVAGELAKSGRKDLRVHSEMISDGTMKLVEAGAVQGKVKYSFAMGSGKMLKWMNRNRKLESDTSDNVNDPVKLAQIKRLVSINTALRIDLHGDANAQFIGNRFYSGVGGQQDFFRGAMMSQGGKAIMAIPSTSTIKGPDGKPKLASKIVLKLGQDDVVTTSMHDIQYVVTEYGVAHLEGKSMKQRAEALIKIAHPQFRKELRKQVRDQDRQRKDNVLAKEKARRAAR